MRRTVGLLCALLAVAGAACRDDGSDVDGEGSDADPSAGERSDEQDTELGDVPSWVYQLQGYADDGLGELAEAPQPLAVIDLARDAADEHFSAEEVGALQESGKTVLAYFEIGAIEEFRPEHPRLPQELILNRWRAWPEEHFVRYWEPEWWELVVRARLDQALAAGFDGVYLDTPLAYEEIDLALLDGEGEDRQTLGRKMVDLIVRISEYTRERAPGFMIVPQNAPELREHPGYTESIDGLGVEELFFIADDEASDQPCVQDWCAENLDHVRALRDEGKLILAVDYAVEPANVAEACRRYAEEGFAGYVTNRPLDTVSPPCP